jgi:DNA mismatch repair protein MutL
MPDIIQLLPDAIANQIAAGEVIQRPASLAKELLENAVDSGATMIKLIVKQAGKNLLQVSDNGCGMSETDARMSFEKHATSKIRTAEDLYNIRTMGFRGEALASIAAIAQVELRTKLQDETLGTLIEIEGSRIIKQEPCSAPNGTSILVKNLFYNVPARRNFLKSDTVELKNIIDEFFRISLANPKVGFQLFSNDAELYHLKSGNLKQRIVQLFGDDYAGKIVPVEESSYSLTVTGFIGKPIHAKKTRGEQFIFVNNRFIKSAYLHHAVVNAYSEMISKESHPFYVLFLDVDPARIDINVHPQKYEIKFEDEKLVYTFVNLGAKHALGAYSVSPTIDFNQEHHMQSNGSFDKAPDWINGASITQTSDITREAKKYAPPSNFQPYNKQNGQATNWQRLQEVIQPKTDDTDTRQQASVTPPVTQVSAQAITEASEPSQLHRRYIVSQIKSGFILIDQQAAHERILYEKYIRLLAHNKAASQRQLFPQTIELNTADATLLKDLLEDINGLGFEVQDFGNNAFIIHSFPADIINGNEKQILEELLEQYKSQLGISRLNKRDRLAQSLAVSSSIKAGKLLGVEEMRSLIDELFACENPYTAPNGRLTFSTFSFDEVESRFRNKG